MRNQLLNMEAVSTEAANIESSRAKVMQVGIDDGYAHTKLALPDGRFVAIPSRAHIGRSKVSWIREAQQLIFEYETDGSIYSVGEVDAAPTRFEGYACSGMNRAIVQHALQCADLEATDIRAVSGLPVSSFYRSSGGRRTASIDAKRSNLLIPVQPRSAALAADITEHDVIPEALAAWYDHVIQEQNDEAFLDQERVKVPIAVIDIGGRTTDTVVVRDQGILHGSSGSCSIGLLDVKQALGDALEERFDIDAIDDRLLTRALKERVIRLYGNDYDVSQEVFDAKHELVERLYGETRRQLGRAAELDRVLFVGGGALALADHISDWFPNQVIAEQPAFANARGMLKYLRFVCADEGMS
jgi:plasmid segregation protein ParM